MGGGDDSRLGGTKGIIIIIIIIIINGLLNKAIVTKVKLQLYHRQKFGSFIQQSGQVWDGRIKIPIVITQKLLHLVAGVIAQRSDRVSKG